MKRIMIILLVIVASAFLTQGFQCASREMTTAKVKYKSREFKAALQAVEEELAKRPNNDEAKLFYADLLKTMGKNSEAVAYVKKTQGTLLDTNINSRFKGLSFNIWFDNYEKSTKAFEKYQTTKDVKQLDTAIIFMENVYQLRKELATICSYIAEYYAIKKDDENMVKWMNNYLTEMEPNLDFGKENGLRMNVSRDDVIKLFGKPLKTIPKKISLKDSASIDVFKTSGGKEVYVISQGPNKKTKYLKGWRVNMPSYWHQEDKQILLDFNFDTFNSLIQYYLDKKEDNKALELAQKVLEVDPENKRINALVIELYQSLNKIDDAIAKLNVIISKDPKNKIALGQMGDIYRASEQYDKAIEFYQKVLKLDASLTAAKINTATCFKNKAGQIQLKQVEASDKDPKYQFKPEEYAPFLRESAKYYLDALTDPEFEQNADIYKELLNIYLVLGEKDKLKETLAKFESFESTVKDKETYYSDLLKIYGALKDEAKIEEIMKKIEALNK